jgi:hypothetical protein
MIMTLANGILTIQRPQPQATTRPTTTNQNPTTDQDLQNAARDLRQEIRNNIQRELNAARAKSSAQAQPAIPQTPVAPPLPGQITIRRPDGNTVISVPPGFRDNIIPQQFVDISIAFFLTVAAIIIGLPLARAFARRMDRRGATAPMSNEIASQLTHLNQAVDAIALEVERISEGQRFTTRLLSEQREAARQTLPSGAER